MIDVSIELLKQVIQVIPLFVCIVLIFNIISSLLWGDK